MLRREFLKSVALIPFAGIATASVQPSPETDTETMVKLWLKSVEWERGVSPVTWSDGSPSSVLDARASDEYQMILWTSDGNHLYACTPESEEVPVYYPTQEMAWTQWKLAFEAYLKDNHGRIHWLTRPELPGPRCRSADPGAAEGFAVYAAAFVEPHA